MKLRTVSSWFLGLVALSMLVNFAFLMVIRQAFVHAEQAEARRSDTMRRVTQLRQETALLRRLVSSYTASGDPRYLLYYYDVLGGREGTKPEPTATDPILYWEEVIAGRRSHHLPAGHAGVPLAQRLQALDVGRDELDALQAVMAATEKLKKTEVIAFAATQGLYDRKRQAYVDDGEPDLSYASELVRSKAYENQSADLAQAVSRLNALSDQRTAEALDRASRRLSGTIWATLAVDAVLLPLLVIGILSMRRRLLVPIERLDRVARKLADGDYGARARGRDHWVTELDTLAVTLNHMAQAVEDDIARHDQVQDALKAARDQAEAATQAKSRFLANMSHEIRTPMNAILGMTHLALQTPLDAQQTDYLQKAERAGQSLLGVINDILDFSKIEAGRIDLDPVDFRLADVVEHSLILLRQRAQEKGIALQCHFEDEALRGAGGHLHGDALRLGQILTNLLSNAVKFTDRGQVVLSVSARPRTEGIWLRLSVSDSGIGMTEAQVERLFQEFTQADSSTTRRFGGTGLGLSISQRLAQLMGGEISVSSQPGQGSTFTLGLPLAAAQGEPSADGARADGVATGADAEAWTPAPVTPQRLDGLRVLLVEDNALNQQIARELLQRRGAQVTVAQHGLQAVQILNEQGPAAFHVVLMDLQMPVMDGHEATARLRADARFAQLPIIAMTAHVMPEERARCLAAGMNEHIGKPLDPARLARLLAAHVPPAPAHSEAAPDEGIPRFEPHPLMAPPPVQGPSHVPPMYLPRVPGLDARAALVGFDDDLTLYQTALKGFVRHAQAILGWLPDGLHNRDWARLHREGHTLRGLGGTIGCERLRDLAGQLERSAQQEQLDATEAAVLALTQCLAPLILALQAYLEGRPTVDDATPARRLGAHPTLGQA